MKIYVAFYDLSDGCDRESWSVFYTPCVVSDTKEKAYNLAVAACKTQLDDDWGEGNWEDDFDFADHIYVVESEFST